MAVAVRSMVAATYVRDIDGSRAFYELLGFREQSAGEAATSAWSYLGHDQHRLLLASTSPPLDIPGLPLLFYFFFDDLDAVLAVLAAAGVQASHLGYPPHALGGEVKLLDPDGNTVLIGQQDRSAGQPAGADDDSTAHFSLLKEAAATVAAGGGTTVTCQVSDPGGQVCQKTAEVRLADSAGDKAWACITHAEEILLTVPAAFIASKGDRGIARFLSSRQG